MAAAELRPDAMHSGYFFVLVEKEKQCTIMISDNIWTVNYKVGKRQ